MNTAFLLLLVFQNADYGSAIKSTAEAQRRETQLRQVAAVSTRPAPSAAEQNTKEYAIARDQEFIEKFNKLVNTLMEFSDSYKNGQTIEIKKAQAIRKAWLELEKSEPLFQDGKKK